MIDRAYIVKVSLVAAAICLVGAGVGTALKSLAFGGGIMLGAALGVAPFLTWSWLIGSAGRKAVAALLFALKIGLYAGSLYLLVTREIVDSLGVFVGVTGVLTICTLGMMARLVPIREGAR